jgi:hypothetical protein
MMKDKIASDIRGDVNRQNAGKNKLPLVVAGTIVAATAITARQSLLGVARDISHLFGDDDDLSGGTSGGGGESLLGGGSVEGVSEFVIAAGLLAVIGLIAFFGTRAMQDSIQSQNLAHA